MLFKQGFWRWAVALVCCLVQSRFWHDGGQVSAVLGAFPLHAHSKAVPALGMCRHSMALPKATHPAFTSLSRQGWRSHALLGRSPESCHPLQGLCPLEQEQLPPPGPTSGWKGYGGAQIHPAPGSWQNFSPWERAMCHLSPSPSVFWTQVFNEWRKTD